MSLGVLQPESILLFPSKKTEPLEICSERRGRLRVSIPRRLLAPQRSGCKSLERSPELAPLPVFLPTCLAPPLGRPCAIQFEGGRREGELATMLEFPETLDEILFLERKRPRDLPLADANLSKKRLIDRPPEAGPWADRLKRLRNWRKTGGCPGRNRPVSLPTVGLPCKSHAERF